MPILVADFSQAYAISGDTVSTIINNIYIGKGSFIKLWLSGDFDTTGESYQLKIGSTVIYSGNPATGAQDEPVGTSKTSPTTHYMGEFVIPDNVLGIGNFTFTGITGADVNNSLNPAARAWIELWANKYTIKRGFNLPIIGNTGRTMIY